MRIPTATLALILISSCGCTGRPADPPLRPDSQEKCSGGNVNETFRGELRGLVFQNLFLEELDGDEDVSRAAVPRQVTGHDGCAQRQSCTFWGDLLGQVLTAMRVWLDEKKSWI